MAEKKYVGAEALIRLVAQLKAGFSQIGHKHTTSDIEDYTVDSSLSSTSTNPVQNKAIKAEFQSVESAIASKADKSDLTSGTVVVKKAEHADAADSATNATNAENAANADHADSADTATSATKATQDGNGKVIADTYQTIANATSQHNTLQSAIDGKVPTSRTVNGKALTANITLSASDVGAAAADHGTHVTYSTTAPVMDGTASVGSASTVARSDHKHPTDTSRASQAEVTALTTTVSGKVDKTTTVNGKALSGNISLTASDVGATTKDYVDAQINNLIENSDSDTLNSITELSNAIKENDSAIEALNSIAAGKANASHTHGNITNAGAIGTAANKAVITTTNGVLTTGTVPVASGGTGSTTAAGALTNLGLTATAAELNKLDGVTTTTAQLNYINTVTSNVQSQIDANESAISTHAVRTDNPHGVTAEQAGALPIEGGTLTGILYTSASTPFLIGKNGKVGIRAATDTKNNVGQINISNAWYGNGNKYGSQISAYNGEADAYNEFRVSHDGLQYNCQDGSTYQVLHEGNFDEIVTPASIGAQVSGNYATKATTLSGYGITDAYTKGEVDEELSGKANTSDIPTVPTKVSAFANDAGYLTDIPSEYVTETELSAKGYLTSIPSEYITESELTAKKYLTSIPSEYVTDSELTAKGYATQSNLDAHTGDEDVHITSDERSKLAGIAAGAQVNTITGVKGSAESTYRTGTVNITAANIGLGNVNNTSDANKPVSTAQQSAIDSASASALSSARTYADGLNTAMDTRMDSVETKLSGIADGANKTVVDSSLSSTSTNPVQNKVVNSALDGKVPTSRTVNGKALSSNISLTASDVGADASGTAQTKADAALASAKSYTDQEIAELINSAPTTLDTLGEIATAMQENADVVEALEKAIGTKADASTLTSHINNKSNPHGVTLSQLDVTATAAELNIMDGVTATTAEINKLDGLTATTAELNYVDGVTSGIQGQLDSKAASSTLTSHTSNTTVHITSTERTNWNAAKTHADSAHAPSNAEKNQNAFSNVKVGDVTVAADTTTDTLTLIAGSNVALTPNATNDSVTIAATDTVYTHPDSAGNKHIPAGGASGQILRWSADGTAAWGADNNTTYSAGTGISLSGTTFSNSGVRSIGTGSSNGTISVNTNGTSAEVAVKGLGSAAYTASSAYAAASHSHSSYVNQNAFSNVKVGTTTVAADSTTDTLELVGSNVTITPDATNDKVTIGITKDNVVAALGYTPPTSDTNTTYSAGTGISLSGTTFSNSGVRSIASGSTNGTISVNTNGTSAEVAVKGLGSAAYTASTAYAAASHTHNYAASTAAGGGAISMVGVTTAGDGAAYTATVAGITSLTAGVSFIMIPHTNSTTTTPTLNVNGLGAKGIRMRGSSATGTAITAAVTAWLASGRPVQLTYNGIYWLAEVTRPAATDLSGTVAIANGGTGATTKNEAANSLAIESLIGGTAIAEGDDLNNYKTVGNYYSSGASLSSSLLNVPSDIGEGFQLKVRYVYGNYVSGVNYLNQEIISNNGRRWVRGMSNNSWTNWRKSLDTGDSPVVVSSTEPTNDNCAIWIKTS